MILDTNKPSADCQTELSTVGPELRHCLSMLYAQSSLYYPYFKFCALKAFNYYRQVAAFKFTHRPKIRFFRPAGATSCTDSLAVQNFTAIGAGMGGNSAPKYQTFPLFGKESPRRGEHLDRFLKFLPAFIRLTILH